MQFNRIHIPLSKGIYAVAQATRSTRNSAAKNLGAPLHPSPSAHKTLSNFTPLIGSALRDLKTAKQTTPPPVPPPTWITVAAERAAREASRLSAVPDSNFSSRLQGSVGATGKPPVFPRSSLLQEKSSVASKTRDVKTRDVFPPPTLPKPFSSTYGMGHMHHRAQHLPTVLQNREIYRAAPSFSIAQNLLSPHRDMRNGLNHSFAPNHPVQRPAQNHAQPIQLPNVDGIAAFIQKSGLWNGSEGDFAIEWIASHPALTDGRPLHIWQGDTFSKLASASEILDNRPIHIVRTTTKDGTGVEGAHYSAAKLINGQLHVFNTAGDGDCFFRSVLAGVAGIAPEQVTKGDIQKMRNWTATSILGNKVEIEKRFSEISGKAR